MKFEPLGNIVSIAKGKKPTFSESPNEYSVRVLQIDDLRNDNNIKCTDNKTGVFATEEDVLIAWDGANAGTIGFGKTGYIGSTIAVLRKKNPKDFDTVFIGKFLQSQFEFLRGKSTGATIPHIDRKSLESLRIPLLSVTDQLQIANILTEAENLISQRKQSIALLEDFLKSTFLEIFGDPVRNEKGWRKSELKEFAKIRIGPFGSLLHREDYVQNGVPLVNPSHISDGKIIIDSELTISKEKMKDLSAYVMHEGDVVLGRRGEIGRCAVVTENEAGFLCGTGSIFIRPSKALNPTFLYNVISSSSMRKVLENLAKGITMKNLNSGIIEDLEIPVPPIELQSQFSQIAEKIEALKSQYQSSLQELENLYGSLSQRAFRGELTLFMPETQESMAADANTKYEVGKGAGIQPRICNSPEKAILAGHIIYQTNNEYFGRVKFQKLLHLTSYFCKVDVDSNFTKKAAGPHDGHLIAEIESTLSRFHYYNIKQSNVGNHKVNYTPLSAVNELEDIYTSKFEAEKERIDSFLEKFKKSSWEQCEIVSTLYAVWNNRIIRNEDVPDDALKQDFLNWDAQKVKYKDRLDKALQWMRDEGVIPDGWGKLIE